MDETLWQRIVIGDEAALGEAYDAFGTLVFGLAVRLTGDRFAAEDVTQEVFASLWERPLAFDPARGTLRGWLALLARRRAVDWIRRQRRCYPADLAEPADGGPGVEEAVLAQEQAVRVRRAVAGLPGPLRETIELAYFSGHSYRRVAAELGIPEGTAKSRMRLGLRHLAATLTQKGGPS